MPVFFVLVGLAHIELDWLTAVKTTILIVTVTHSDGGKTFGVVHSEIGGCPLAKRYAFKVSIAQAFFCLERLQADSFICLQIPDDMPAGKDVLLAWTVSIFIFRSTAVLKIYLVDIPICCCSQVVQQVSLMPCNARVLSVKLC